MKGGGGGGRGSNSPPPPEKTTLKKPSLIRVKMVVLTPKLGIGIPLHTKFLRTKYFKSSHYRRKTQ